MENDSNPPEEPSEHSTPGRGPAVPDPAAIYRFGWSFYLWLAIAAVIWIGIREDGFRSDLFVTVSSDSTGLSATSETPPASAVPWPTDRVVSSLALDVGLGVGSGLIILLAWSLLERAVASAAELGRRLAEMLRGLTVPEALALAFLSSLAEELFFRGAVQGSWPGPMGFVFATFLFALVHGGPGREFRWWSLFALVAGGVMGMWVLLRGNLTAAIFTHWTVNSIQLVRIARSTPDPPGQLASPSPSSGEGDEESRGPDE